MPKISQIDEVPCQAEVRILQKITLKVAPKQTENNDYEKFWSDQQRVLWNVMAFSVEFNSLLLEKVFPYKKGIFICRSPRQIKTYSLG